MYVRSINWNSDNIWYVFFNEFFRSFTSYKMSWHFKTDQRQWQLKIQFPDRLHSEPLNFLISNNIKFFYVVWWYGFDSRMSFVCVRAWCAKPEVSWTVHNHNNKKLKLFQANNEANELRTGLMCLCYIRCIETNILDSFQYWIS